MVDVFLRICSKAPNGGSLRLYLHSTLQPAVQSQRSWYTYQTLDEKREENNVFLYWNPQHGQHLLQLCYWTIHISVFLDEL